MLCVSAVFSIFFFQAEDGIRDGHVTGVQTCALPISHSAHTVRRDSAMLKGFKEFIMRGNVVDLAVAVVIGAAFAAIVDTVVSSIITPLLNAAGGVESAGLGFHIISGQGDTFVDLSAIINAVVVFLKIG